MYFRQETLPSATVLQVTGQLTIHHSHHIQPGQYSRRRDHLRTFPTHQAQHANSWQHPNHEGENRRHQEDSWRKESKQPLKEEVSKPVRKDEERNEKGKEKEESPGKREQNIEFRRGHQKGWGRKEDRSWPRQEKAQNQIGRGSVVQNLRELEGQLQKIEQAWETDNGSLHFQAIYQLREIRENLELQTSSLLCHLQQQVKPFSKINQECREKLELESSLLAKEKENWKQEKEQLVKQMEAMLKTLLEEERKEAEKLAEEKLIQLINFQEELKTRQTNQKEEIKKLEQKLLNLIKFVEAQRQKQVDERIEDINNKLDDILFINQKFIENQNNRRGFSCQGLKGNTLPIESSSEKITEEKQDQNKEIMKRLNMLVDRTTKHAHNFRVQNNTITLHTVQSCDRGDYLQAIWLDVTIGKGVFSLFTHINEVTSPIIIGVGDNSLKKTGIFDPGSFVSYVGIGIISRATGMAQNTWESSFTLDQLISGTDVLMEVDLKKGTVTWTIKYPQTHKHKTLTHSTQCCILKQTTRKFSPFYWMTNKGESVTFELE